MAASIPGPGSDEEWETLMRQLRLQPPAEPSPFFYARVRTRLLACAEARPTRLPAWLRRPAYAAVLGALVLAVSGDGLGAARARPSPPSNYPTHQTPPQSTFSYPLP